MLIPTDIEGILVERKAICKVESRFENHTKFTYHRCIFSSSFVPPESISPCIPMLHQLIGIRTIQNYTPVPSDALTDLSYPVDLNDTAYFLGYWPSADRWQSQYTQASRNRSIIFYRDDFKPLHPKQIEALWSFCDRLCVVITPPLLFDYILPGRFSNIKWVMKTQHGYPFTDLSRERKFRKLACLLEDVWKEYCTVDNFNAFFELYKRNRLLSGDEIWREVGPLYDTQYDGLVYEGKLFTKTDSTSILLTS